MYCVAIYVQLFWKISQVLGHTQGTKTAWYHLWTSTWKLLQLGHDSVEWSQIYSLYSVGTSEHCGTNAEFVIITSAPGIDCGIYVLSQNCCVYFYDFYGKKNIPKPKPILPFPVHPPQPWHQRLPRFLPVLSAGEEVTELRISELVDGCVCPYLGSKSANHSRKRHGESVVPSCFFKLSFLVFWGCLFQGLQVYSQPGQGYVQLLLSCGASWCHLKPIEVSEIQIPTLLPLLKHPRMICHRNRHPNSIRHPDISEIFRQDRRRWTPILPFQSSSSITNPLPFRSKYPSTKARWSIPSKPPSFETCETVSILNGHLPATTGRGPSLSSGHGHGKFGLENRIKFWVPDHLLCSLRHYLYLEKHSAECFPSCEWYHWVD